MNIRPRNDVVLVEILPEENVSTGGIVLVHPQDSGPYYAKVLAVGVGKYTDANKLEPLDITVGQTVIIERFKRFKFECEGKELMLVSEYDVLAIVE